MIKTSNLQNEILDLSKEFITLGNKEIPFTSLLLRKGVQKVGAPIVNWKYKELDSTRKLALEGADVTEFQSSNRSGGDKNICQIIEKAVSVSGTASAVTLEGINSLFEEELADRIIEVKRDLEYFLVNGIYTEENGTTPRQMRGLVSFAESNKKTGTSLTLAELNAMSEDMSKAGTASDNLFLLCDYNTNNILNTLFTDKERYINVQNEFGSVVKKINLNYASAYVYVIKDMPVDTCILLNLDYLKLAELRGLKYNDLAKTGDSKKGFIVIENTLKVLHPEALQMFKKTV